MGETTCSPRSSSLRWLVAGAAAAALLLALSAPARADKKKALELYEKGSVAYNVGQFDKAIEYFTKAYEAHQAPSFLFNIAQAHRQAGRCKKALFFYGRYLTLEPEAENRTVVEENITELEGECGSSTPDPKPDPDPDPMSDPTPTPDPDPMSDPTPPAVVDDAPVSSGEPTPAESSHATGSPAPTPDHVVSGTAPTVERELPLNAFAELGPSFIAVSDLEIPTQVSFHFGADYHVADASGVAVAAGLGLTITPLPWDDQGTSGTAYLYSFLANANLTREVMPKLRLRAQVGLGFAFLSGITDVIEQPFTEEGFVADGIISMPTARFAVGAEYDIAEQFVLTASPIVLSTTNHPEGMAGSFDRFEMLAGVTYLF